MKYVNIVLDIDLTLSEASDKKINLEKIFVFDQLYYLYHGCREFIMFVAKISNKLIFFSNGHIIRNNEFVSKLLENTFKNPGPIIQKTQIFSRAHKRAIIKNLLYIVKKSELPQTVLVDDDISNIMPGQEKNFMQIFPTSIFQDKSFINFNKLFYAAGLLSLAFSIYQENNYKFIDILNNLQKRISIFNLDIYTRGLQELSQFNPEIKFKE